MNKKGFTLIELLAVIVILAIIALIATPIITGIVANVKKGGAESSALGWIDAINKQKMINEIDADSLNNLTSGIYTVPFDSKYNIKVKGQEITSGWVEINENGVNSYSLVIDGYVISYDGVKKTVEKGTDAKSSPMIVDRYVYTNEDVGTHIGFPIETGINVGKKYIVNDIRVYETLEEKGHGDYNSQYEYKDYITPDLKYVSEPNFESGSYLKLGVTKNGLIATANPCRKYNGEEICYSIPKTNSEWQSTKEYILNKFTSCVLNSGDNYLDCDYQAGFSSGIIKNEKVYINGNHKCTILLRGAIFCE